MFDDRIQHHALRKKHRSWPSFLVEEFVVRSWWVFLVCLVLYAVYEQSAHGLNKEHVALEGKLSTLTINRDALQADHDDLLLQINSQSDYAWVELTLMKGLGLVPEDQRKFFFTTKDTE